MNANIKIAIRCSQLQITSFSLVSWVQLLESAKAVLVVGYNLHPKLLEGNEILEAMVVVAVV